MAIDASMSNTDKSNEVQAEMISKMLFDSPALSETRRNRRACLEVQVEEDTPSPKAAMIQSSCEQMIASSSAPDNTKCMTSCKPLCSSKKIARMLFDPPASSVARRKCRACLKNRVEDDTISPQAAMMQNSYGQIVASSSTPVIAESMTPHKPLAASKRLAPHFERTSSSESIDFIRSI